MNNRILVSPYDGKEFELNGLNKWKLRDIHYQEEIKIAKKILTLPAFSEERKKLLNESYEFVETLKLLYEKPEVNGSFGETLTTVKLVIDVIKERLIVMIIYFFMKELCMKIYWI